MEAVTISLVVFVVIFFMNPSIKLMQLIYKLAIMFSKPKPEELKKQFGDWAVVTGATDGVGKEYAKELAKRDMNLVLVSRSIEKLNKVKDELQMMNFNIRIKVIEADFARGKYEFEKIRNQLKDIAVGILVNNVGTGNVNATSFGETPEATLWDIINVNVGAATMMTHMIIEDMKARKRGAIINISYGLDIYPAPYASVYGSTKAYLRIFTDALREEYSKFGITIQRLSPFYINTKMVKNSYMLKNHPTAFPTAASFARGAIKTIGKLNGASGYWIYDIAKFFLSLLPMAFVKKAIYTYYDFERNYYLRSLEGKVIEQ